MSYIDSHRIRRIRSIRAALAAVACAAATISAPLLCAGAAGAAGAATAETADPAAPIGAFGAYVSNGSVDGYHVRSADAVPYDQDNLDGTYSWVVRGGTLPDRGTPGPRITGVPADVAIANNAWTQHDLYYRDTQGRLSVDRGCTQTTGTSGDQWYAYRCSTWGDTVSLYPSASSPSAAAVNNTAYVFFRDGVSDGLLMLATADSGATQTVHPLGGMFVGDPVTVQIGGELDTFVVNSAGQLWDYVYFVNAPTAGGWHFVKDLGYYGTQYNITASMLPNWHVAFALRTDSSDSLSTILTWSMAWPTGPAGQQTDSTDFVKSYTGSVYMDRAAPVLTGATLNYLYNGVVRSVPVTDLGGLTKP